jgi:hypothetical protein
MSSKTIPWKSSSPLTEPFFEIDESLPRELTRPLRFQGHSDYGEEIECLVTGGLGRGGQGVEPFTAGWRLESKHMGLRISDLL